MIYLLCIVFPPLAVVMTGRAGSDLLNIVLCLLGGIPGMIHAILVVNDSKAEKRHKQLLAVAGARA